MPTDTTVPQTTPSGIIWDANDPKALIVDQEGSVAGIGGKPIPQTTRCDNCGCVTVGEPHEICLAKYPGGDQSWVRHVLCVPCGGRPELATPSVPQTTDADPVVSAWQERNRAWLAEVGQAAGFDDAQDHAALIARYFAAANDRYSADRHDPVLGPIIKRATERYGELRKHDFTFANRVAHTEAVRAILAMELLPHAE